MKPKTKIEIDPLFTDKWDSAYVVYHKKENRRYVILRNSKTDKRTTMQYARYLMCIKLGKLLNNNDQVDHIDGDKMNDSPDNLQVLTRDEHFKKTAVETANRVEEARSKRVPKHGTFWEHKRYGCNCDACVKAYKEYSRNQTAKYRAKLKEKGLKRKS